MVKVGIRKPSIKKSVKARTTGKMKRKVKSSVNPMYGKKGMGWVNNPKKAAYNKVYNKTTKSVTSFGSSQKRKSTSKTNYSNRDSHHNEQRTGCGCWTLLLAALVIPILAPFFPIAAGIALFVVVIVSLVRLGSRPKQDYHVYQEEYEPNEEDWKMITGMISRLREPSGPSPPGAAGSIPVRGIKITVQARYERSIYMSISSLQQKEKTLLNDINRLEKNLVSEQKKASDADKKIADCRATISRSKVTTTIRSKERTIETETKKSVSAKSKVADLSGKIAKKRKELGDTQVKLSKARTEESEKFQKDLKRSYDRQITKMKQIQNEEIKVVQSEILNDPSLSDKEFDIFISYASEDSEYVDKLEQSFKNAEFSIWRDKSSIGWGQSIRQSIDDGLAKSKFGIVVLSSKYIEKYWTGYELDGILNKESSTGRQMILPLWHNVTKDEIDKKSPSLSNRLALDTRINSLDEILDAFKSLLE